MRRGGGEGGGRGEGGEERWLIPLLAAQALCCPAQEEGAGCLSFALSLFHSRPSSVTSSLSPLFPLTSLAFSLPICPSLPLFLTSFPPSPPLLLLPSLSPSVSLCHWKASQCENAILLSRLLPISGCGGKRLVCAFFSFPDVCRELRVCTCVCDYHFAAMRTIAFFHRQCF